MLYIGVNKIKIHLDTSQLCCGVVHLLCHQFWELVQTKF